MYCLKTYKNWRLHKHTWAVRWDFQQCGMCDQQSLRSVCPYGQSDQSICLSLEYSISVKLPTGHHLIFLSITGGCTGSSESTLVKIPHCWRSHVAANMYFSFINTSVWHENSNRRVQIHPSMHSNFTYRQFWSEKLIFMCIQCLLHHPCFIEVRYLSLMSIVKILLAESLFDLILYVPSTIFQLYRDGSSWIESVLSKDKCVLLKDHNTVTPVRLEPAALRSRVKHSTTEPLRSQTRRDWIINYMQYYMY